MADTSRTQVDFWFDPLCPWTWMTSRWLTEVATLREIEIRWHVMSLAVLNEDKLDQIPQEHREQMGKAWRPVRVLTAVLQKYGNDATGRLYTEFGARFHRDGTGPTLEAIGGALEAAGLPDDLVEYADSSTYDADVRASHQASQDAVGEEAGSPVLAVSGPDGERLGFFGPIAAPIPRGEVAGRLWDAVLLAASVPGFAELKRTRTADPVFD
ncbi:DsbA family protein [Streptomyces sp. bgisy027]|uniref:mycothiol-dependent nitroreductase Rv2466c family protein n=1 Tax=unclassified Streptomyces TaxID=2593676 RepID=UPI003D7477B6